MRRRAALATSSTPPLPRQAAGEHRRGQRVQVGLARESDVEWLEPFGGLEQQRRGVAAAARRECDLRAEQVDPGALELVERSGLGDGQQSECRVGRAGQVLGLRRGERALRPARGVGRQRGGTLQKRGRCRQPSARLSAARRALELGRRRPRRAPASPGQDARRGDRDRPSGSVASASARCTACRSSGDAARYTAERTSG